MRLSYRLCIYVLVPMMLSSGCFQAKKIENVNDSASEAVGVNSSGTRVFLIKEECPAEPPGQPEAFALAAALIPILASAIIPRVIDYGANKIKKIKEGYGASYSARGASLLYKKDANGVKSNINCIVVVRGKFGEGQKKKFIAEYWNDSSRKDRVHEQTSLISDPDFYFEAQLVYSDDLRSFRLVPNFLDFAKSRARYKNKVGLDKKNLNIAFIFEAQAKTSETAQNEAFGTANIVLEDVIIGKQYKNPGFNTITSQWIPLLPIDAQIFESTKDGGNLIPFSVLATVQEVDEGGDILLKISEGLSEGVVEKKGDITQAIVDAIKKALEEKP